MTNIEATAAELPIRASNGLITLVRQEGHYRNHIVAHWEITKTVGNMLVKRGLAEALRRDGRDGQPGCKPDGFRVTDDGMAVFTALINYTPQRHALLARMVKGSDGGVMYQRVGGNVIEPVFAWTLHCKPFDDASMADDLTDLMSKQLIRVDGTGSRGFSAANPSVNAAGRFVLMLWDEQHPA